MGKKLTVEKTIQAVRLVQRMKPDIHNSPSIQAKLEKRYGISGMQANFLMCAVVWDKVGGRGLFSKR